MPGMLGPNTMIVGDDDAVALLEQCEQSIGYGLSQAAAGLNAFYWGLYTVRRNKLYLLYRDTDGMYVFPSMSAYMAGIGELPAGRSTVFKHLRTMRVLVGAGLTRDDFDAVGGVKALAHVMETWVQDYDPRTGQIITLTAEADERLPAGDTPAERVVDTIRELSGLPYAEVIGAIRTTYGGEPEVWFSLAPLPDGRYDIMWHGSYGDGSLITDPPPQPVLHKLSLRLGAEYA